MSAATSDREILKALLTNPHLDLGDLVYRVRESEGKGWDGPAVKAWSDAVTAARTALKGAAHVRVLTPDNESDVDGDDYTLNDEATGCWIAYKGVALHIFTPFGEPGLIRIEALPCDDCMGAALAEMDVGART